jgi:hypothetical protein
MQGLLQPHPQPLPRIRGGELKNVAWDYVAIYSP